MKRTGLALLAFICLLVTPARAGAPWEGRWRLVVQTYGAGASNLVADEIPVRLQLAEAAGLPTGLVWSGSDEREAASWPALTKGGEGTALEVVSRQATAGGSVEAVYRVRPVATDDLVLVVREVYTLSADGDSLEGTVEVRFESGQEPRGGYTLHRRFARER